MAQPLFPVKFMKIILLKPVKNLGQAGEIKEVNNGYARNFLIPQGLADVVTKHSLSVIEAQKRKREKQKKQAEAIKIKLAKKIANQEFVIEVKTDKKGTLYAKLDAKAIARKLNEQGIEVEAKEIDLGGPIKKAGEYNLNLKLAGQAAKIKLVVK